MLAVWTLWKREMVRFFRQPSRVVGALGSPILFWILIGSGVGTSFSTSSLSRESYLLYFFPGTLYLILLFTAIFSTISIIEDRREGFLQGVWVSPVSRSSILLGKMLGGGSLAFLQAVLFLGITPCLGIRLEWLGWAGLLGFIFVNAFMLTGMGFILAWNMKSIQGFHALMNLFLMPAWLLSGALFPPQNAHPVIQAVMRVNPMSYGVSGLRSFLAQTPDANSFFVILGFTAGIFLMARWTLHTKKIEHLIAD